MFLALMSGFNSAESMGMTLSGVVEWIIGTTMSGDAVAPIGTIFACTSCCDNWHSTWLPSNPSEWCLAIVGTDTTGASVACFCAFAVAGSIGIPGFCRTFVY